MFDQVPITSTTPDAVDEFLSVHGACLLSPERYNVKDLKNLKKHYCFEYVKVDWSKEYFFFICSPNLPDKYKQYVKESLILAANACKDRDITIEACSCIVRSFMEKNTEES